MAKEIQPRNEPTDFQPEALDSGEPSVALDSSEVELAREDHHAQRDEPQARHWRKREGWVAPSKALRTTFATSTPTIRTGSAGIMAEMDFNSLQTKPSFTKQRTFPTYFDTEQLGFKPKDTDVGFLTASQERAFREALAACLSEETDRRQSRGWTPARSYLMGERRKKFRHLRSRSHWRIWSS